jgi:hypothetical protein
LPWALGKGAFAYGVTPQNRNNILERYHTTSYYRHTHKKKNSNKEIKHVDHRYVYLPLPKIKNVS